MASTYSDRLRLELMATGENSSTWGTKANVVFSLIDEAIGGYVSIGMADANVTLSTNNGSSDQARNAVIKVTGANTATRDILAPAEEKMYVVHNAVGNSHSVRILVSGGTAVTVANGDKVLVYCDGTDFYEVGKAYQPVDATLTALAGVSTAADKVPYFTGTDTASVTDLTSFARTLLDDASASAARTTLGLVIGTNVQAFDADLTTWASITPSADVQSLVSAANFAAMRTLLGLVIGTNVQAYDADLTTWAGLTPSANAQSLVTAANYAAMVTLLGVLPLTGGTMSGTIAMADNLITRPKFTDYGETVNAIGSIGGGTQDIDITLGNVVTGTIDTSTTTFTFSNPSASGVACSFTLILTNGGSQTINWPASVDWPGGIAPTLTSSGVDILTFMTVNAGTTWYGFTAGIGMA